MSKAVVHYRPLTTTSRQVPPPPHHGHYTACGLFYMLVVRSTTRKGVTCDNCRRTKVFR